MIVFGVGYNPGLVRGHGDWVTTYTIPAISPLACSGPIHSPLRSSEQLQDLSRVSYACSTFRPPSPASLELPQHVLSRTVLPKRAQPTFVFGIFYSILFFFRFSYFVPC